MAEQQDEKPKLPLAGIFALLAMVSSFLIYQEISLQTSRPISKGVSSHVFAEEGIVQSRLWQDPFEAVESYRLSETKITKETGEEAESPHQLTRLIEVLAKSGISSQLQVLPVFVDGSPYSSGAETRLNDRYAVISALGAAGYTPESGEYIRFFVWNRAEEKKQNGQQEMAATRSVVIPAELFIPKEKLESKKHVLVIWLKAQDFGRNPFMSLNELMRHLDSKFDEHEIKLTYNVLGPRFSTGLRAMVQEVKDKLGEEARQFRGQCPSSDPPFDALRNVHFYSPWATAEDTFLLDDSPFPDKSKAEKEAKEAIDKICSCPGRTPSSNGGSGQTGTAGNPAIVERLFSCAGIKNFSRTIGTDAELAEHLVQELDRRQLKLANCSGSRFGKDTEEPCEFKVALISEWDTLYGRALPRTFVAVASSETGSGKSGPELGAEMNKLRRDEWPEWVSHHSYLAGLDGELPATQSSKTEGRSNDKDTEGVLAKGKAWYEGRTAATKGDANQRPEGRSQIDYLVRLAAALKQEEAENGKFKAIGVLGSDVYDKLLILQALRQQFPDAIFFTTDLNARLAYPAQWEFTHNLVIASHFGLKLQPKLQIPIPPFRDSYQTSLFYAALMALGHLAPVHGDETNCLDCVWLNTEANKGNRDSEPDNFFANTGTRLYEIGRSGAFDISIDPHVQSKNYASIHPARPDLDAYFDTQRNLRWLAEAFAAIIILILGIILISTRVADFFHDLVMTKLFWAGLVVTVGASYSLVKWVPWEALGVAGSEPFVLTEGISAWPTAAIRLLALVMSLLFLWYSWRKMKNSENVLTHEFDLEDKGKTFTDSSSSDPGKGSGYARLPFRIFSQAIRRILGLHVWRPQSTDEIDAVRLWREYTSLGALKNFGIRGLPQLAVALGFAWLMMMLFGFPNTPCRGSGCFLINNTLIIMSLTAMMILIFYVVDATRLCRRWVNCIATNKIHWPAGTLGRIASKSGINKKNLDEWLGIELIAERTSVIGNFIYFPFIIIVLLAVARHGYIDNWGFPTSLVIIYSLNAILVVGNALALRRTAEKARREAIKRLESKLVQLSTQTPEETRQRQQIEWAILTIKNNKRGAFLPFTQHPIFGAAIALPSGGYGLLLLLEYMATGQ
jgi:hypothetical protein